jgi:hypothetical protein
MPRSKVAHDLETVKEFDDEAAARRHSALLGVKQTMGGANPKWNYWVEKVGSTRSARKCGGIKWAVKRKPKSAFQGVEKKKRPRPFTDCVFKIPTVKDLKRFLASIPDDDEHDEIPLAYSHDDEGNYFQCVLHQPSFLHVQHQTDPCDLKFVKPDADGAVRVLLVN